MYVTLPYIQYERKYVYMYTKFESIIRSWTDTVVEF